MNKHAFLVGVGEYDSLTISPVHFAVRDAETIGGILRDRCGFKTTILSNPAAGEVARSLGDLISLIEDPDDLFCFFFAGHGAVYEGESYLLLKDAYPEARGVGMYQLSTLQDQFARLRSRCRLVFLDCCRNDPRAGKGDAANLMSGRLSAALNGLGARDIGPAATGAGGGHVTLLLKACREGERAYEWEARRHGAFSWFLKEGLEGAAWRDGELKAHELCNYVSAKVSDWAERLGRSQQPDFQQSGAADNIVLAARKPELPPDPVECPMCGKQNPLTATFRCKSCGRDKLCQAHQDAVSFLCMDCERKRQTTKCPMCGKPNAQDADTFRCKGCGRDKLCRSHQDPSSLLCADCERKRRKKEKPAETEPEEKKSSGKLVAALLCLALIGGGIIVINRDNSSNTSPPTPPHREHETKPADTVKRDGSAESAARSADTAKPTVTVAKPEPTKTVTLPGGVKLDFVLIEPGTFKMGSPEGVGEKYERPQHTVTITKPYYLGKYEVTQAQWQAVMGSNSNPSRFKGDNRPVEQVSWDDVQQFVERLNGKDRSKRYRLPTEAEWEFAAREKTSGKAGKGDCFGQSTNGKPRSAPSVNDENLHDMFGNVSEWVQDWYGNYQAGSVITNPAGPNSGKNHVIRGGNYSDSAAEFTAATRRSAEPKHADPGIGFRLVLDVDN